MKKLFLSAIAVVLAGSAYAIPNSFSEGDIVSAEKMNENFQALEQQFQGSRATTVNCAANEKIGKAIDDGYTNITVSGTCTENLQFSMWREDSAENGTPTGKLAPRFLKLTGADANAKIVDGSSNTESTLSVNSGATLFMENITVSGGENGVNAQRNSNLYLSGVTVENFSGSGLRVADSAWLGIDDGGVTISGGSGAQRGINMSNGSSGWVHTSNISNVQTGINLYGQSFTYLYNFTIEASNRGINLGDHSTVVRYQDGAGVIEGTSEYAINASRGNFYSWSPGSLTIQKLNGGRGINVSGGNSHIANLKMPDYDNTGSDWNPAINVETNSSLSLENAEITGSTDGALVSISGVSVTEIQDSTLTVGSAEVGIEASGSSRLSFRNSTISGSVTDNLVNISDGSNAEIRESTVTATTSETWSSGIYLSDASGLKLRESTVEASHRGMAVQRNSYAEMRNGSSITGSANHGVTVYGGAGLKIRSGSSVVSTGNSAIDISQGSWTEIDGGDGSTINRTDDGEDISVGTMSLLSIYDGNSIGEVGCYSKGYVSANEGTVTTLADSCTE